MSEEDKKEVRKLVGGDKPIPMKWVVFSILVFALVYQFVLMLNSAK